MNKINILRIEIHTKKTLRYDIGHILRFIASYRFNLQLGTTYLSVYNKNPAKRFTYGIAD